jgi:signal transduction histidine kinase
MDDLEPDKRDEAVESIVRQSERLLLLIDRLLDAARSQARATLIPVRLDLIPIAERLVNTYANAHGRRIVVERQVDELFAHADPDAIEQILANLLENAVKHTPEQTTVWVRLRPAGENAQLIVADNGPGIPVDLRDSLFQPYRQGEVNRPGVGLGLFIVSSLVTAMGGSVDIHSEPGGGTTFTIELPSEPVQTSIGPE